MRKNWKSYRVVCLGLAICIMLSSFRFTVDLHYCKNQLKSFSLIGKAASCHDAKKSCPHHSNEEVAKADNNDCCSNHTIEVDDLDVDYNVSAEVELTDLQIQFVASLVYSLFTLSPPSTDTISPFPDNKVLLPSKDICVLLERFLL